LGTSNSCSCLEIKTDKYTDDEISVVGKYVTPRILNQEKIENECRLSQKELEVLFGSKLTVEVITKIGLSDYSVPSEDLNTYFKSREADLYFNIENDSLLYQVTDTLLPYGNNYGLNALWGRVVTSKLNHFDEYCDNIKMSGNIFQVGNLICNLHFSNSDGTYDNLISELQAAVRMIDGFEEEKDKVKSVTSGYTGLTVPLISEYLCHSKRCYNVS
jgi:hypothetical protein